MKVRINVHVFPFISYQLLLLLWTMTKIKKKLFDNTKNIHFYHKHHTVLFFFINNQSFYYNTDLLQLESQVYNCSAINYLSFARTIQRKRVYLTFNLSLSLSFNFLFSRTSSINIRDERERIFMNYSQHAGVRHLNENQSVCFFNPIAPYTSHINCVSPCIYTSHTKHHQ